MSSSLSNWSYVPLQEVVGKITSGGTPKAGTPSYYGGDIPFLKIKDLTNSTRFVDSASLSITERGLQNSSARVFPSGTVLTTMYGTIGVTRILRKPMATNQAIAAFLELRGITSEFLMQLINFEAEKLASMASQTTQANISATVLKEYLVDIPPLPEQKKIASILTSVDEVIENTQKQIDKLQDLKKAIMNELLTRGIGHTEFKDSELGRIPKSWEVQPLLKLSKGRFGIVDGPFGSNLKTEHYKSKGIPVIQSGFVTTGQFYAKKYVYVDSEKFNAEIRSAVASGDIVMAKIGAQAGRCAIMPKGHPTGILAGNSLKITTDEESLLATYLNHLLSHLYTTGEIQILRTETAQPAISIATLKKYKIKVPTLLEQEKITKVLSTIDIKLKSTREKSEKLQSLKKSLMQDLLTGKVRVAVN
jgi:type I restriction enzyme, S subunit